MRHELLTWTNGGMLHEKNCSHFGKNTEARPATPAEIETMAVCSSCEERLASRLTDEFVCPSCFLTLTPAMRGDGDLCKDCA